MILGMMIIMTKMRVFNDDNDNDKDDDNDDAKFARRQPDSATPSSHLSSTHLLVILIIMRMMVMMMMMMVMVVVMTMMMVMVVVLVMCGVNTDRQNTNWFLSGSFLAFCLDLAVFPGFGTFQK